MAATPGCRTGTRARRVPAHIPSSLQRAATRHWFLGTVCRAPSEGHFCRQSLGFRREDDRGRGISVKRGEVGRGAVGGRGPPGRTDRRRPSPHRDMPHALGPAVCGVRGWFLRFPRQRRGPPPVTGSVSEPFQAPSRAGRESASVLLCRATASSPSLSCPSPVLSHVTRVAGSVSQCPRGAALSGGLAGAAPRVHRRVLVPPSTRPAPQV